MAAALLLLPLVACAPAARTASAKAAPVSESQRRTADKLYYTGVEQYLSGDLDDAIATWRRVLQADPAHPHVRQSLRRARLELDALQEHDTE